MNLMKVFVALFFLLNNMVFASDFCENLKTKADVGKVYIDHNTSVFKVISKGRLYLKSAPDNKCKMKYDFLVPGDQVVGYAEYSDYIYITYFKDDGDSIDGWLSSSDLKNTGLTNGPSTEEQMVFNMIPDLIKNNNLSSLLRDCLKYDLNNSGDKYFVATITNVKSDGCSDKIKYPFTILINKESLEAYTNQGGKEDEFRKIEGHK